MGLKADDRHKYPHRHRSQIALPDRSRTRGPDPTATRRSLRALTQDDQALRAPGGRPRSIEMAQRLAGVLDHPLDWLWPPGDDLNVRVARAKDPPGPGRGVDDPRPARGPRHPRPDSGACAPAARAVACGSDRCRRRRRHCRRRGGCRRRQGPGAADERRPAGRDRPDPGDRRAAPAGGARSRHGQPPSGLGTPPKARIWAPSRLIVAEARGALQR